MKLNKRKSMSIALASGLSLTVLVAGCGSASGGASNNSSNNNGGVTTITYMMRTQYVQWLQDLKWFPVLEQKTNTKFNFIAGGEQANLASNVDLKVASGNMPDMIQVNDAQTQVYGTQGAFVNLAPLLPKDAPHLWSYLQQNPTELKMITHNGAIYAIPQNNPLLSEVPFYRSDMFKAAGITTTPTNLDELTKDFQILKQHYSNVSNFYPYEGRDNVLQFDNVFNSESYIDSSGKVHGDYFAGIDSSTNSISSIDIHSPGFKQQILWYKSLYDQGLIDPEWVLGTQTQSTWETKMLTGKGAFSYDFFTRPEWFMTSGGPKNDPNFSVSIMPYPKRADGSQAKAPAIPPFNLDKQVAISSKSKNITQILKLLDYLYTQPGETLVHYGVESRSYKMVNGQPKYTVNFAKEGSQPEGTKVWNFLQDRLTFPYPVDNNAYYNWMDPFTRSWDTSYFKDYSQVAMPLTYTPDQAKQISNDEAKIRPDFNSWVSQLISGRKPMSDWNQFIAAMNADGYQQVVQIDQQAYDAMQKSN